MFCIIPWGCFKLVVRHILTSNRYSDETNTKSSKAMFLEFTVATTVDSHKRFASCFIILGDDALIYFVT